MSSQTTSSTSSTSTSSTSNINNTSSASGTGSPTVSRGRALLFDYLPHINIHRLHFSQEDEPLEDRGGLFVIYQTGESYIIPFNYRTNGSRYTVTGKLLSQEPTGRRLPRDTHKSMVYDVPIQLADMHPTLKFNFLLEEERNVVKPPRKVLLSPNKELLLLFGVIYKGQDCLVVYQIMRMNFECFKLIYYDLSITYIDVCFTPDSRGIALIPARFPSTIFILNLPVINEELHLMTQTDSIHSRCYSPPYGSTKSPVSYEPRTAGPLRIIGPAEGVFGKPIHMTHIASNNILHSDSFDFVTWNDEGTGEYCLWAIDKPPANQWYPRILGNIYDQAWLTSPDSPKNTILSAEFSTDSGDSIVFLVRRHSYPKASDTGIGIQMVPVSLRDIRDSSSITTSTSANSSSSTSQQVIGSPATIQSLWYRVADASFEDSQAVCLKWTHTLLLGSLRAAAVIILGKGMVELVDYKYGSEFQNLYDDFCRNACNFVQIDKYRRYWAHKNGNLGVILVDHHDPSIHPEWAELFKCSQNEIWEFRMLGRQIGYYITDIETDSATSQLETIYNNRKGNRKDKVPAKTQVVLSGTKEIEELYGLHLYVCFNCKRVLIKPLQCGGCKCAAYCSRDCQRAHWLIHRADCLKIHTPKAK